MFSFFLVCNLDLFEITEWELCMLIWTQTSWQVMQRDSDTADSGKPCRIFLYSTVWKEPWVRPVFFSRKMLSTRYWSVGTRFEILGTRIGSLKCLKNPGKSVAVLPQIWKIHCCCETVTNVPQWIAWSNDSYAGLFSHNVKTRGLLEYVYADLWVCGNTSV